MRLLLRIPSEKQKETEENSNDKKTYEQRYLVFLQSLHQTNKSKKEIEEV